MSTNTTARQLRATTKTALFNRLDVAPGLQGVSVTRFFPGDLIEYESVFAAGITGRIEFSVMAGGRIPRDDVFTILLIISSASPGLSAEEAEANVDSYITAILDELVADGDLSDVVDGLWECLPDELDGPHSYPWKEGFRAQAELHIRCQGRTY